MALTIGRRFTKRRFRRDKMEEKKAKAANIENIASLKKKPQNIAKYIVYGLLFLVSTTGLLLVVYSRQIWGDSVGDRILGEGVQNGWMALGHYFSKRTPAIVTTLMIIAIALVLISISNFLVRVTTLKGKKAKTVGSLIRSLIKYIIIILSLAFILGAWGVDVGSIVAGLGVLTLIIGLGCQSLIQDVVSGLFIVFDDYFSVGDMIIVDGFRGYVESIGLRTVKLDDHCGNVKAITNSQITTVVNLSRSPNLIYINFTVSYNEDLERMEGVLAKEFPKINAALPQLEDPLIYKGVDGYDDAGVVLAFGATCKAEYRFQVARDLKREIYLALVRNNIEIPYAQIVVNAPDPKNRPFASKEEKMLSQKMNAENRKLDEVDEKTLLEKAKEDIKNIEKLEKTKKALRKNVNKEEKQ